MMKRYLLLFVLSFSVVMASASGSVKKNNLKTTVLSYITGSAKITYERALFEGQSVEFTAGRIGVGGDAKHNNPKGVTTRGAYKWMFPFPNQTKNPLDGFYLKPELAYSRYSHEHTEENALNQKTIWRTALMACVGWQCVKDWFVFDFYIGAGGAVGDKCPDNYYHGFIGINPESNTALTFGLKLGFAI